MVDTTIRINSNLSKVIEDTGYFNKRLAAIMEASQFIVEREYIKQVPVDQGDLKQKIRVEDLTNTIGYRVTSNAKSVQGKPYPVFLHQGTGRLRGAPDFGFTTGRVRNNEVAFGIGGIRPNKFAKRARDKAEKPTIAFINKRINKLIIK